MSGVSPVSISISVLPSAMAVQEYISDSYTNPKYQNCFIIRRLGTPILSTLDGSDLVFDLVLTWQLCLSGINMNFILTGIAHELHIRTYLFQCVVKVNFIHDTNTLDQITQ